MRLATSWHQLKYVMKAILLLTTSCLTLACFGQNTLVDDRDNKSYQIVEINGTLWMADNLDFETGLSSAVTSDQKTLLPLLSGRYYHLTELKSVCPIGWELPDTEDWLGYFEYPVEINDAELILRFIGYASHFVIDGYDQKIDLFERGNPLNLVPTGRLEGENFYMPDDYADFWITDPPTYTTAGKKHEGFGHVHVMPMVIEGKTHIHMRKNGFTNIHSHEHHLNPNKEKKLRRFMIRCVRKNQD